MLSNLTCYCIKVGGPPCHGMLVGNGLEAHQILFQIFFWTDVVTTSVQGYAKLIGAFFDGGCVIELA